MKITRIYNTDAGVSQFDDLEIDLKEGGTIGSLSVAFPVSSIVFRETPSDYDFNWHLAPHRQYIVLLDGAIEIETGCGAKRQFTGGDILLVEDTWGSGHKTRTTDGKSRRSIFIRIDA